MSRSMRPSRPWSIPHIQDGLETKTYTRKLTYGQAKALKYLTNRFLKRLGVNKKMADLVVNQTSIGEPGSADTYRVRIRWYE